MTSQRIHANNQKKFCSCNTYPENIRSHTLQPLTITKIQTAKMGASSEIRGELKQKIYLQLGGCKTRFRGGPVRQE
jgi:hypothetical protein